MMERTGKKNTADLSNKDTRACTGYKRNGNNELVLANAQSLQFVNKKEKKGYD